MLEKAANVTGTRPQSTVAALSDLEGAALAVIARLGSATAYIVARDFATSPSEFWSGSAGAVYPMIKRLVSLGHLAQDPSKPPTKRGGVHYQLTEQGRTAMLGWLLDVDRAAGMGFDPLRTRMLNLDLVDKADAATFLASVLEKTKARAGMVPVGVQPRMSQISPLWWKSRVQWVKKMMEI
jgi:DNA-binding PadR family transcriptional regulator